MSLDTLPKVLVVTLEALLHEYGLSSWSTRSGHEFTTINIRFDHAAMTGSIEEIKYRRVSQAQIIRDRDRSNNWNQQRQGGTYPASTTRRKLVANSSQT